ncbi:MAG: NADH-quinone oxidoreductase subunit J [Halobacteriovoraceae bacterium]|nr:NADH-quinone oxidoreductase subunit J [Halobacteriovoraceae bacterium]
MFINFLFLISAILTIGGAIGTAVTKNIMHACVYLLASLLGVAGLYATLGADFVAATQLVVYVGGVVILMVFAVMLTGGVTQKTGNKEHLPMMGNRRTYIIAISCAIIMIVAVYKIVVGILQTYQSKELPPFKSTLDELGILLVTDHVLAFEMASVLLLGALIGAAMIARPEKEKV